MSDMVSLQQAIELYRLHHLRYPDTLDDLVEADIIRKLAPDPWGTPYELHVGIDQFRCAGPDQKHGTLDDLYDFSPVLGRSFASRTL